MTLISTIIRKKNSEEIIEKEKKKLQELTANQVQELIDKDNQYAIITYPKGYYYFYLRQQDLTKEEKKIRYQPYSADDDKINVIKINPLRTTRNKVYWWMNGPLYRVGSQYFGQYFDKSNKKYYAESIILDKVLEKDGIWYIVIHPTPLRYECMYNSQLMDISRLKNIREGRCYRAYIKSEEDNKYYVVDVIQNIVRCVNDGTIYNIQRQLNERTVEQLWKEICVQINTQVDTDTPWKQPKAEAIVPLPLLDYKKYIGLTPFIDIGNFDHKTMNIMDEEKDVEENKENNETDNDNTNNNTNNDNNNASVQIPHISFPEISAKIPKGRIKNLRELE